jgi:hypothetical protein
MSVKAGEVKCNVCGAVIVGETPWSPQQDKVPCSQCGSMSRLYSLEITTTVRVLPLMFAKARHEQPGQIKPFYELKQGYNYFKKTGAWHWILQIVDRDKDYYRKFVRDVASGKILKDQTERYSQHIPDRLKRGRGNKSP